METARALLRYAHITFPFITGKNGRGGTRRENTAARRETPAPNPADRGGRAFLQGLLQKGEKEKGPARRTKETEKTALVVKEEV